jgi:hypothetical protein
MIRSFNLIEYIYYRVVFFYIKNEADYGMISHKLRGIWVISLCLCLNIHTVFFIFFFLLFDKINKEVLLTNQTNVLIFIISTYLIIGIIAWLVLASKNHERIIVKYSSDTMQMREKRGWLSIIYLAVTFGAYIVIVIYGNKFYN